MHVQVFGLVFSFGLVLFLVLVWVGLFVFLSHQQCWKSSKYFFKRIVLVVHAASPSAERVYWRDRVWATATED